MATTYYATARGTHRHASIDCAPGRRPTYVEVRTVTADEMPPRALCCTDETTPAPAAKAL